MLSEEVAVANALYIGYASPNNLVVSNEDYKEELGEDAYDILYSTANENISRSYYHSFSNEKVYGDDMQQYVNALWEQLKTETQVEVWVHVTSITIVVTLLALCSYSIYIKKKRSKFYRSRDKEASKS
jgi:hypothetical protein